ncbi:MAG: hypothetical protein KGI80_04635 [Verrucomicrobiota bacterium]|nr:hypothetical protein [Verrucomicrobiota bacterium]
MRRLIKVELNYDNSMNYIKKNFFGVNEMSSRILETLSSVTSKFYVLLPQDANRERIYNFASGYVTSNVDKEISHYVVGKMKEKQCFCIFDDVNTSVLDNMHDSFYLEHYLYYKNEVYYTIKREILSEDVFFKCMIASDGIWHSLCVITKVALDDLIGKELSQDLIEKICKDAQLVMVGAYDGEGYIFWERN